VSAVQVVRHDGLVALHLYGSQACVVAAGQCPAPSQFAAGVNVLPVPGQLAWRQPVLVDHGRQAPLPSQVPSFEQSPVPALLATHFCLGSAEPAETGEQVPTLPVTLQLLHRPPVAPSLHAVSQQTPSVQKLLWHWLAAEHVAPFAFLPHELFTQVLGDTQSVSAVQVLRHTLFLQMNAPQLITGGVTQAPEPSQVEAMTSEVPVEHASSLHLLPLAK